MKNKIIFHFYNVIFGIVFGHKLLPLNDKTFPFSFFSSFSFFLLCCARRVFDKQQHFSVMHLFYGFDRLDIYYIVVQIRISYFMHLNFFEWYFTLLKYPKKKPIQNSSVCVMSQHQYPPSRRKNIFIIRKRRLNAPNGMTFYNISYK